MVSMNHHRFSLGYIRIVQDMYWGAKIRVKTAWGTTNCLTVRVGVHQGSALTPFLFIMLMDDLLTRIREQASQCKVLAYGIAQMREQHADLETQLRHLQQVLVQWDVD